jgi:exodeoxyribonuclease VII large subunit
MERRLPEVQRERQQVDDVSRRALSATEALLRTAAHGVGGCVWRLRALDPFATLERGYAVVQRKEAVVASVHDVRPGDALDVRVKDGTFGVRAGEGPAPRARRLKKRVPEAQAPLFDMPEERA